MAMQKPNQRKQMTPAELKKFKEVMADPVKWSQIFLTTFDGALKKETPWTARWYQCEMLRDNSLKKVYRCGRRTGKTETMVVDMLWRAFTRRNYRCLTITPYENQVRLQFQRIRELIENSPLLKVEVASMTKNPYQVTFKNNSAIFGFTTGASSGNAGASIRGQRADWLYLDECDQQIKCLDIISIIILLKQYIYNILFCVRGLYERKRNEMYDIRNIRIYDRRWVA